jgi:4-amino-4-deoxy-L-arabinose transferase-like glycosyltransferase
VTTVRRADLLLLTALALLPVLFRLGTPGFWDPDEGRYASIPRTMLATHDFLTPRLNGTLYFEKPPLVYWATAASFAVFGSSEWSGRLVSVVAGAAGVALTWWFTTVAVGPVAGWLAALVFGTCAIWAVMSRVLIIDTLFSTLVAAAMFGWYAGLVEPRRRSRRWFAAFVALALAVLAKGPVALVLCGVPIVAHAALMRRWRDLQATLLFVPGWLVFAAIAAPWFIGMTLRHKAFAWFFFVHEHWLRYTTPTAGRSQPFWFFLAALPLAFWPWSLFLPRTLAAGWRGLRAPRGARGELARFCALWAVWVFAFFSLSHAKLLTYVLPAYAPLSIVTALALADLKALPSRTASGATIVVTVFLSLVLAALLWLPRLFPVPGGDRVAVAAVALSLGITSWALARRALRPALLGIAAGSALLVCGVALAAEPFNAWYSTRALSRSLAPALRPGDRVAMYRTYRQSANYYTGQRIVLIRTINELEVEKTGERESTPDWFLDTREQVGRLLGGGRVFIYVPDAYADNFEAFCLPHRVYVVKASGDTRLYTNTRERLR